MIYNKDFLFSIAVDGSSASGKTTGSKIISKNFGFNLLSSGKLYRYVAYKLIKDKKKITNKLYLRKITKKITLKKLKSVQYNFTLGVVDATSSGFELPDEHAGVGLARKIGMDLVLPHLSSTKSLIFCTDADTIVSKDYFEKVITYYNSMGSHASVVGFKHLESNDKKQEDAIRQYETYLLTTAKKMRDAGSPYGYVAMGSTIVCTVEAYCAVGGMSRKKATEDFYFLQELAK